MIARFPLRRLFLPLIFVGLALSSCASGPKLVGPELPGAEFASLGSGALGYFYVDVAPSRPLLDNISIGGMSGQGADRILDRVKLLSGAVYPSGSPRRIALHAWSQKNIPGGAGLALSSRWKKLRSPGGQPYWHSGKDGLSVALRGKEAFVSDGDPFPDIPAVTVPEKFQEFRRESLMAGWLENAGTPINNFLSDIGIPMQIPTERILVGIYPSVPDKQDGDEAANSEAVTGLYELRIRVETQNATQARTLTTMFSFMRGRSLSEDSGIKVKPEYLDIFRSFLDNPPIQDGGDLIVRTGPMNAREIALLFNRFSLYSQAKENKNADL
jgi:hypothetical protein